MVSLYLFSQVSIMFYSAGSFSLIVSLSSLHIPDFQQRRGSPLVFIYILFAYSLNGMREGWWCGWL